MTTRLPITSIRLDGGTQPRAEIDRETVAVYADAIENGDAFPPITVYHDGKNYWCADGFHRIAANEKIGYVEIDCSVIQGSVRDAVLFSVGANRDHGLRRTNADKRRAVMLLLNDEEWSRWSDREIARRCAVSADLVGSVRLTVVSDSEKVYRTKHGTTTTMKTETINEGRKKSLTCAPNMPITSSDERDPSPSKSKRIQVKEEHKSGLEFATMAIAQLERIHPADAHRQAAFDKVERWIREHR